MREKEKERDRQCCIDALRQTLLKRRYKIKYKNNYSKIKKYMQNLSKKNEKKK